MYNLRELMKIGNFNINLYGILFVIAFITLFFLIKRYLKSEKKDEDLAKFEEESSTDKETGVTIYKEAGKTEYGFWMIINPGETKTVDLEYIVPSSGDNYQFYIQKQPGLDIKDLKFYLDGKPYYDGRLDKDMVISLR